MYWSNYNFESPSAYPGSQILLTVSVMYNVWCTVYVNGIAKDRHVCYPHASYMFGGIPCD